MREWKGAFLGAYRKGWEAERCGKFRSSNPYKANMFDVGTGHTTYGIGFFRAWNDGFDKAMRDRNKT